MNAIVFVVGLLALAGPPEKTSDVQGRDLGKSLRVIGSLGRPLGERTRIRGEWQSPGVGAKDPALLLHVREVNGVRLEREVVFPAPFVRPYQQSRRLKPRPGDSWEAVGYEFGGFKGSPDWALTEVYGEVVPDAGVYLSGFKFILEFVYTTVSSEKESPISK